MFVEKEPAAYVRLTNTTGSAIANGQEVVLGKVLAIAQEAIGIGGVGAFLVGGNMPVIQTADLVTGEDTFGTANAPVYFDSSSGEYSDTKTIGYFEVGQVAEIKAGGVVKYLKYPMATVVPTLADLADVDVAGVTNNDTLKYVTATGKWTDVAVAD